MNIYFFSSHDPDPEMIQDLGGSIKFRFKGCINDIHARDNQISFTETLHIGGETCEICHTIPAESIIVTEAPLATQAAWLEAGAVTLLIPQVKQEIKHWGHHSFKYVGLTQVHKIEVVTSPWGRKQSEKTDEPPTQNQKPSQPAQTANVSPVLNLFNRLAWQPPTLPHILRHS